MVKISTMDMARIDYFMANGKPKTSKQNFTTIIPILTMTMSEKQTFYGQNGKPLI